MREALRIDIASDFTGKKAFKDADKGIKGLSKGVKDLAKVFGISLGAKAIADFGKASVKAFADDQREATRLAKVIDNLGLSFANPEISRFIDDLTRASGVSDSQLRPAFQALITTTGSLTNSQAMLQQAIDISVGSGIDLTTVAQDLANAYVGNTKGLKKYNLGLTQAELKAAKFSDIQARLNKLFSGSNAALLDTYAGKMQLFSNSAKEAQEIIGQGLMDALASIAGDGTAGVESLTKAMDDLAMTTADVIRGIGDIASVLNKLPMFKNFDATAALATIPVVGGYLSVLAQRGRNKRINQMGAAGAGIGGSQSMQEILAKQNAKIAAAKDAESKKRANELAKATKANTKALKDQAALKKTAAVFDQKQIEIVAALKGKISEEEKVRLNLLLAIEQGNVEEANKWGAKLAEIQKATMELNTYLTTFGANANNPFKTWYEQIYGIYNQFQKPTVPTTNVPSATNPSMPDTFADLPSGRQGVSYYVNNNLELSVNGNVVTKDDLFNEMLSSLNSSSLSGKPGDVGRFLGTFAP